MKAQKRKHEQEARSAGSQSHQRSRRLCTHGAASIASSSSRSPLRFGETFLEGLTARLFGNLDHDVKCDIFRFCSGLEFGWSSACSGTDSPAWVQRALVNFLAAQSVEYPGHKTCMHLLMVDNE